MSEPDRRLGPWLLGAALLGLTLSPLLRPPSYDSFPFSSYPMFAHGRKDALTDSHRALAVYPDGTRVALPPRALGTDEVLQADTTLRHAIRRGKRGLDRLCRQIAGRVAADPEFAGAATVEIVSERYDAIAYFAGATDPVDKPKGRARCKVPR